MNWDALPKHLDVLVRRHGAIIVGSQATLYANGHEPSAEKDWDLFIPHHRWRHAAMTIPRKAMTNGNRGWNYVADGLKLDVWPDELARYLEEATSDTRVRAKPGEIAYAVDLQNKLVFQARRVARTG